MEGREWKGLMDGFIVPHVTEILGCRSSGWLSNWTSWGGIILKLCRRCYYNYVIIVIIIITIVIITINIITIITIVVVVITTIITTIVMLNIYNPSPTKGMVCRMCLWFNHRSCLNQMSGLGWVGLG